MSDIPKPIHQCPDFERVNPPDGDYGYGLAIGGDIWLDDNGNPSMDNGEYCVRVRFCPYCGWPCPPKAESP